MAWERELDHAGFTLHCAPVDHHSLAGFSLAFRGLAKRGPRIWVGFALGLCRVSVEFRDERIASIGEQVLLDVFARCQLSDRRIRLCIRDRWFFRSLGVRLRLHHDAMVCMGVCVQSSCRRDGG